MSAIKEQLDPTEFLEREIRENHKTPRYVFACLPRQDRWCDEARKIVDDLDTNELMMVISDNYLGNGKYDEMAIGHHVVREYEMSLENILEFKND